MGLIILVIISEKKEYQSQEQPLKNAVIIPFNLDDSPFIIRLLSAFQSVPYPLISIVCLLQHN